MPYSKRLLILCSVLFFSVPIFAQKEQSAETDITGLWKGTMYNDSTQRFLKYEIAISESEKGKLSGFSHTYFILDDKEYHGVKKVRVKRKDGKIIVEDLELIANNYPIPPAKNVRQLDVLTLDIHDSVMVLSGPFSTNRTKEYASLTGIISVQRKNDFKQSALIPHLQELGLAQELSFADEIKRSERKPETKPTPVTEQPVVKTTPVVKEKPVTEQPVVKTTPVVKEKPAEQKAVVKSTPEVKEKPVATQPVAKAAPVTKEKEQAAVVKQPETVTAKKPEEKPAQVSRPSAVDVDKRTIETIQAVYFKSDSLVLTLYDNGEVDGDTVSVLMNGKLIMPRVGLSTNAVRQTIYTQDLGDSIQIIMYAENLGSLPPNTGLLIVYDGTDRYEIRFSGDMEKSSAIMFRRRK